MEALIDGNDTLLNITSNILSNATTPVPLVRVANYVAQVPVWQFSIEIVLAIFGIVGNSFSLLVYMRVPSSSINVLLRVLASCDLGFVLLLLHNSPVRYVRYINSYGFNWYVAYITSLLMWAFPAASTYTTVAIAVERLLAVAIPLKVRTICTPGRARIAAAVIVIVCIIGRLPNVILSTVSKVVLPDGSTTYTITRGPLFFRPIAIQLMLAMAILFDYLPPLLLVPTNIAILIFLRRQDNIIETLTETTHEQRRRLADRRLTLMLMALAIMSIIGNTPITLIRILSIPRSIVLNLQAISNYLYIADHCANFVFYVIINTDFRQKFFEIFTRKKSDGNWDGSATTLTTSLASIRKENLSKPNIPAAIGETEEGNIDNI